MSSRVNYGGLVVAGIGFLLTRFTVTLAIYENPVRFYVAGVIPLALGLGLAAFGVALAVADVEAALARTTAVWCVVGTGTMAVLVALTLVGASPPTDGGFVPSVETVRAQSHLSNFLIGGSVGGALTGVYAARNNRQRSELRNRANRLTVLNRMLRHEVLNAVTVIQGYATTAVRERSDGWSVVEERSRGIESAIQEVADLTRQTGGRATGGSVDLGDALGNSVAAVADQYPDADVSVTPAPEGLQVRADARLERVFTHLLRNALEHTSDESPTVALSETETSISVSVQDDGPGLPEHQQRLLETGNITEFDDPGNGFGLNVVRFLVDDYGGRIETDVGASGTTVTVVLPRADDEGVEFGPTRADISSIRPAIPHLVVTLAASMVAGVFYAAASISLGGSVAGIGVFYGLANPVVGWLTHEFHSVVFGFTFLGLVTLVPERYHSGLATYLAVGVAWGLVLWIVAAGVVAPVWLRLLGIPAPVPNFSLTLLVSHLAWGASLGLLTHVGYVHAAPLVERVGTRFRLLAEGG